jgi:transcriptional regulator with XRE-family HTH domain
MAKIKVHPHPGALSGLLKQKNMTQEEAKDATGIDRKTLRRIERGEQVKEDTLRKLANGLRVPVHHFVDVPSAAELTKQDPEAPLWPHSLMLRELDADGLLGLLKKSKQIRWLLNLKSADQKVFGLLEEFERVVNRLHEYFYADQWDDDGESLSAQLHHLEKVQAIATLMERLAENRVVILGADYLHWTVSQERNDPFNVHYYRSTWVIDLSIEQHGTSSRRVPIFLGSEPPKVTPETDPPTKILVNGVPLDGVPLPPADDETLF